jgi:hypothetical protein
MRERYNVYDLITMVLLLYDGISTSMMRTYQITIERLQTGGSQ